MDGLAAWLIRARPDRSSDRSDVAAFDLFAQGLDQLRHLVQMRVEGERLSAGAERALIASESLHDQAKPRQRPEMAGLAHQHLLDILQRMAVIVLQIIQ